MAKAVKLFWLDGHMTLISKEEELAKSREEPSDDGYVHVLIHGDFEFEWHDGVWMQR